MLKNIDLSRYVVQHPIKIRPDANLFDAVDLIVTHRMPVCAWWTPTTA